MKNIKLIFSVFLITNLFTSNQLAAPKLPKLPNMPTLPEPKINRAMAVCKIPQPNMGLRIQELKKSLAWVKRAEKTQKNNDAKQLLQEMIAAMSIAISDYENLYKGCRTFEPCFILEVRKNDPATGGFNNPKNREDWATVNRALMRQMQYLLSKISRAVRSSKFKRSNKNFINIYDAMYQDTIRTNKGSDYIEIVNPKVEIKLQNK